MKIQPPDKLRVKNSHMVAEQTVLQTLKFHKAMDKVTLMQEIEKDGRAEKLTLKIEIPDVRLKISPYAKVA